MSPDTTNAAPGRDTSSAGLPNATADTSPTRATDAPGPSSLAVTVRVAAKEMALFVASPIAWLFLASFAAIALFIVFWGEAFFARNIADVRPLFEWMPVLLILLASALTMRSWSEERRSGTLEHVLAQAAPLWSFVLGKFAACLALLAIALAITLPLPITVSMMGTLDWGPVWAGYAATLMLGAAYIAIGLFVSARTDNQIVALIGSIALCGAFWLIGSPLVTSLLDQRGAELLGSLSSGARFDAIIRGVIDLGDLVYYVSLAIVFLAANVFVLERERWASDGARHGDAARASRHRRWGTITALVVANALVLNLWVGQLDGARLDTTAGGRYTLSDATTSVLAQLQEPLLLRAYFSERTHPLLSPLVPEMRDLLREYEVAGDGRVHVEFVDPASAPDAEREANERYGIEPVPFRIADRYESSIVSSYFDVLVQYGDSHEVLGFRDLIDVRSASETDVDVRLRNPEFDLSRAIRRTVSDFVSGGDVYASLPAPVTLRAWISPDERLPDELAAFRRELAERLAMLEDESGGKLAVAFADPDAGGGEAAARLAAEVGLRPLSAGLFSTDTFWFHLLLDDGEQLVQLPLDDLTTARFEENLETGLQRFAGGFTKTVALAAPGAPAPGMAMPGAAPGPGFTRLAETLRAEYRVVDEDLADGHVASEADLLIVAAPESLDDEGRFAIDQFLMRGGTVILATSPYTASFARNRIDLAGRESGLSDWLAHHGITIGETLVMDPQSAAFPVPVARNVGGMQLQELRLLDYPYFVDIRRDGMADGALTGELGQLTMAWASPITLGDPPAGVTDTVLLHSSDRAWLSASTDITPRLAPDGGASWTPGDERAEHPLAIVREGTFTSFFAGEPSPLVATADRTDPSDDPTSPDALSDAGPDAADVAEAAAAEDEAPALVDSLDAVIERSPESARLIVFASNDFLGDRVVETIGAVGGTSYLAPLQLVANAVDAALDDSGLAGIRARGAFNRTLDPMSDTARRGWEWLNYALAAFAVALVYAIAWLLKRRRERRQLGWMNDDTEVTA